MLSPDTCVGKANLLTNGRDEFLEHVGTCTTYMLRAVVGPFLATKSWARGAPVRVARRGFQPEIARSHPQRQNQAFRELARRSCPDELVRISTRFSSSP